MSQKGDQGKTPQKRVFLALWPDESTRGALHHLARGLDVGGRPVPRAHLHLTLAFPGSIEAARADCLAARLPSLHFEPIPILLDRAGQFHGPRVAWAGPSRSPEALDQLAARARGLCLACGVESDDRPFEPHVSLRRHARPPACQELVEPIHWFADTLALIESGNNGHPGPYRLLARWPAE
ncbi:RNA 2',3'-cyclic phosphodiesterase [Guyparkeria halophila]|uniref:RNA 2',3'-cyclic phosphodiesterase n=1 Tax=Guyparkeria halophila TaxID=47960 RepID=A0ABZ0YYL6_9GAMM|nr:RNA 2',3'-cyclic phosphodiesterase [Guyparkeria halophila]WQH17265.1 RNA 2',3'-cyclic phosphodiesterase [Guyparkeria halophila]